VRLKVRHPSVSQPQQDANYILRKEREGRKIRWERGKREGWTGTRK